MSLCSSRYLVRNNFGSKLRVATLRMEANDRQRAIYFRVTAETGFDVKTTGVTNSETCNCETAGCQWET